MLPSTEEFRTPPGQTESTLPFLGYLGQVLASPPRCVSTFHQIHSTAHHGAYPELLCPTTCSWISSRTVSSGAEDITWEAKHASRPLHFYTSDQPTKPGSLLGSPSVLMYLKFPSAQYTSFHKMDVKYFLLSLLHHAEAFYWKVLSIHI